MHQSKPEAFSKKLLARKHVLLSKVRYRTSGQAIISKRTHPPHLHMRVQPKKTHPLQATSPRHVRQSTIFKLGFSIASRSNSVVLRSICCSCMCELFGTNRKISREEATRPTSNIQLDSSLEATTPSLVPLV